MFKTIDASTWAIWRVAIVFAAVYFAEGLGQNSGLIKQPLTLYFNNGLHWSSTLIAVVGFVTMLPWYIKPLWGMVSDFVPIRGSRRKIYLLGATAIAAVGYLAMIFANVWPLVLLALLVTAFGLSVASTTCGALLVENGKKTGLSSTFVSLQWVFFFVAVIGASKLSGAICQAFTDTPIVTIHISAVLACAVIAFMLLICWKFVDEAKTEQRPDWAAVKSKVLSLKVVLRSRPVLIAGGFIFLYYFSPAFSNPLYLYMTGVLHLDQKFLGDLGAIEAAGYIVGGFLFLGISRFVSLKQLIILSIVVGTASNLSLLFLSDATSAELINFFGGVCGMLATIAGLTLAAEFCPDGAEGITYALLMSVHNLAGPSSAFSGSILYDYVPGFHSLPPLIWVSAFFTALSLAFVRYLKLGAKTKAR